MLRQFILTLAIAFGFLAQSHAATSASNPRAPAVQTEHGTIIPAGAFGVIQITNVTSAKLVLLHGKAGRGTMTLRTRKPGHCVFMELRFVAGSTQDADVSKYGDDPVQLILRNEHVARALMKGRDIVSDSYTVTTDATDTGADFVIESGLGPHHGFVLNPGRNIWAELFSPRLIDIACDTPLSGTRDTATGSDR